MGKKEDIDALLERVITQFNQSSRKKIASGENTILYGKDGCLDSMALVTFVLMVEREFQKHFATGASLAEDKAFSQAHSPFRSRRTLQEYLLSLVP